MSINTGGCARAVAVVVLAATLTACSRHEAAGGNTAASASADGASLEHGQVSPGVVFGANKTFAKVTYRPEVRTIESAEFRSSLVAVSPDGHVFVFHQPPAEIHALKAGDVLLIRNQLARKVLGAADDGEETYVVTDVAMIADVVQDGEISVDVPLIFSGPKAAAVPLPRHSAPDLLGLLVRSAYAQGALDPAEVIRKNAEQQGTQDALKNLVKGLVVSGWTVAQLQGAGQGDAYNYSVVLVKNFQGFVGKVAASGFINNFRFWSRINVSGGLISSIRTGVDHMTGKLHFDWEVAKGTPGAWNLQDPVKLPGTLSVPLGPLLGGLPLTLEMSSAILIHPALTGGSQIQTGGFTITLNGGLNGSIASGGAVDEGSSIDQTFQITNDAGISAVAPDAMVIAYAAPRFELQLSPFGDIGKQIASAVESYQKYESKALAIVNRFAPSLADAWKNMNVLKQISNVVKSNADVYAQLVSTEGVVHAPTISMVPCSKKWLEFSAQIGTAANIAGMTPNAKRSTTVFAKKYERADPPSNFCEKVGS
jgi:hypothetical protein